MISRSPRRLDTRRLDTRRLDTRRLDTRRLDTVSSSSYDSGQAGSWWQAFAQDYRRYRGHWDGRRLAPLVMEQGLWALLQYRVASAIYCSERGRSTKGALLGAMVIWQKAIEILTGISLPYRSTIGPGLYLGHFGPIIVHPDARIGSGCNLSQGVTVGVSGRGPRRGVPTLGDRVYVGANAVICGRITVGSGVAVGANSLVTADVPAYSTVLGVPAKVVNCRGSAGIDTPEMAWDPDWVTEATERRRARRARRP